MKLDTFFDNFGFLADAPNGVQMLRQTILRLSVQGKLVPQNPKDEPASVFIEKIKAEKERLVKEGKIKKAKLLPPILADEIPHKLPKGWVWERLGNLQRFVNGFAFKSKDYEDSGIGIVRIGDIVNGVISTSNMKYVAPIVAEQLDESLYVRKGDLLIAMSGATTGKLGFNLTEQQFLLNQRVGKLELIKVDKRYTHFFLSTKIKEHLRISAGSAIPNLSTQQINNILFPLPPLREQKRIVARVDELMALCDELEARKQQGSINCIQLNDASVHKLLTAREPKKFRKHWQRICDNFDLLYSKSENVNKLRQAILQLAVQGKLVQVDTTVSASDGKKVGDFIKIQNGYAFKSGWYVESGIKLLRNINIGHGKINWAEATKINKTRAKEYERFQLSEGDIVISLDRPLITTGLKLARIKKDDLPCLLLQRVGRAVFLTDQVLPEFFYLWLQSPLFIDTIDPGRSNGVPHISSKSIETIAFNPPSLLIQKKTVVKTEQIMSLFDKFEADLMKSRMHSGKLLNATIVELMAA